MEQKLEPALQIDSAEIGKRIAAARKKAGKSAQKLADEAGLTRAVITNIENGRRDEITLTEFLSISRALRVPPVAILFDVSDPFGPIHKTDVGDEEIFASRSIDVWEWFNANTAHLESSPNIMKFERDLEQLDAVVVYPIGLEIEALFSKPGQEARTLIATARAVSRAHERVFDLKGDFLSIVREHWFVDDRYFDLVEAINQERIIDSEVFSALLEDAGSTDAPILNFYAHQLVAAQRSLVEIQEIFSQLGGKPNAHWHASSPRQAMNIVQSMPHESRAEFEKRGGPATGEVSSPLRQHRTEDASRARAKYFGSRNDLLG